MKLEVGKKYKLKRNGNCYVTIVSCLDEYILSSVGELVRNSKMIYVGVSGDGKTGRWDVEGEASIYNESALTYYLISIADSVKQQKLDRISAIEQELKTLKQEINND